MADDKPTAPMLRLSGAPTLCLPPGPSLALEAHTALIAARVALAGPQPRGLMAALLWPELDAARARANLRQRLLRMKLQAGREWVLGERVLQLAEDVQLQPLDAPEAGELLEGLKVPEASALALWLDSTRAAWRARRVQRLADLVRAAEAARHWDEALVQVQRMLAIEPQTEAHHRELMRLHYLNGDIAAALAAHERLRHMLARDFDAAPSAQSAELLRLIETVPPASRRTPALPVALARPPRLVGRALECAALQAALAPGSALLLLGEAGMGKSRLLAEVLAPRADLLSVKAQVGDAAVPYATLARLLSRLGPGTAAAALRTQLSSGPAVSAGPGAALAWQQALQDCLAQAPGRVVVVDDLQFADSASTEMLLALVEAEALAHLAWVFAMRQGDAPPAAQRLRDALQQSRRMQLLRLSPLDAGSMALLLHDLGRGGDEALAERLVRHTGGNPFFALETLKQLDVDAGGQAALPRPEPVLNFIERRLRTLSEDALLIARVAAIAGPDFGAELAAAVLGRSALALADAWAELEAAQVLRDRGFAHDLVAEAALQSVPGAVARPVHAAVAAWLETQDGAPARVALHWRAAGQPVRALPWLARAAELAHRQLRPVEEGDFLALWAEIEEPLDAGRAADVLLRLARVQVEAGGMAASMATLERVLHLAGSDVQRLQVLNLLAESQLNRLMPAASARAAEQALALARALGDATAAAEAVVHLHRALCMAGRAGEAESLWQTHQGWMAATTLPRVDLVSDRGWVLDRLGRAREAQQWHARALAQAQATGRPVEAAVVLGNLAQGLVLAGEPAQAEAMFDRATTLSARHDGLHAASDYLAVCSGMAAAALGRYGRALSLYELGLNHSDQQSPAARHAVLANRALLWAFIGQRARAQADATLVLAEAGLPAWMTTQAHTALALCSQAAGRDARWGLKLASQALGDEAQAYLHAPLQLALAAASAQDGPAAAALAFAQARALLHRARAWGHAGLRWQAHWVAAHLAVAAGRLRDARRHARACACRPSGQVALLTPDGRWWHGLWKVWLAVGDTVAAEAAHQAGRQWVQGVLAQDLPAGFQTSFVDAVPEHRELLAVAAQGAPAVPRA